MEIFKKKLKLYNDIKIPMYGMGTYRILKEDELNLINKFINQGGQLIDCAYFYDNQDKIGQIISQPHIKRKDLFIVSKVWNANKFKLTKEDVYKQFEKTLKDLKTEYLDLYLVHWPNKDSIIVWEVLEELYKNKKVKAIGVCNFRLNQLKQFIKDVNIKPMVNQIQLSVDHNREKLVKYCHANNIVVMGWRHLGVNNINLDNPILKQIAKKHNSTISQICLKYEHDKNIVVMPKSSKWDRVISNANILDISLDEEDKKLIKNIKQTNIYWPMDYISKKVSW